MSEGHVIVLEVIYCFFLKFWDGMQSIFLNIWQAALANILVKIKVVLYIGSFMTLAILCPSLHLILKLSNVAMVPEVLRYSKIVEGTFKCSLYLSQKVLDDSPMSSFSHLIFSYLNQYMALLFLVIVSLSLCDAMRLFKVCPLKENLIELSATV